MQKKCSHKKQSNIEITQELNTLLKKYNIDKTKYIRPFSVEKFYNPDNVVKGTKSVENLICPICLDILKNPISCNSTKKSHSFCEECINKSLENDNKCPLCRQEFLFGTNKKIEKLLQKLKFKCLYYEEGCPKILDYSIYFKHIDKCGFRDLLYECQIEKYSNKEKDSKKCKYKGTIKKINKHFLKCAFSEFKCPFCSKNIIQANIKKHYETECEILIKHYNKGFYIGQRNDKYEPEGFGKIIIDEENKVILFTEFHDGLVNGYGLLKFNEEILFEGELKGFSDYADFNGYGIREFENGLYKGQFKDGLRDGIGTLINEGGIYEGEFKEGKIEGYGIVYYNNEKDDKESQVKYEGQWKDDVINGYGIMYYKNGSIYNGYWIEGEGYGFGIEKDCTNNTFYIGQYKDWKYNGYGIKYYYSKNEIFKGQYIEGKLDGYAFQYFSNGDFYEGEWNKDKKNGLGFLHKSNGEKYINIWEEDKLIYEKKL